jgi:probable HAF family extracellular repeat protein
MGKKGSLHRWSMAIALVAATSAVAAPGPYALTALGDPPGDSDRTAQVHAINSQGVVAGEFHTSAARRTATSPFVAWAGEFRSLGTPLGLVHAGARGINDRGQVVGETNYYGLHSRAFLWRPKRYVDLGTLGGTWARAKAINNAGTVVGWSGMPDLSGHAFVYQDGVMRDIHQIGVDSIAKAISPNGTVVGDWSDPAVGDRIFIYRDGVMLDLDPLHGPTYANGVNDAGQVVGLGPIPTGSDYPDYHAVLWQDGVMVDLGTLGGTDSEAFGINDRGQIVGHSSVVGHQIARAFIHDEGRMWSLAERVIKGGEGWALQSARAINNRGQITGMGTHNGVRRPFLLTPIAGAESP